MLAAHIKFVIHASIYNCNACKSCFYSFLYFSLIRRKRPPSFFFLLYFLSRITPKLSIQIWMKYPLSKVKSDKRV